MLSWRISKIICMDKVSVSLISDTVPLKMGWRRCREVQRWERFIVSIFGFVSNYAL